MSKVRYLSAICLIFCGLASRAELLIGQTVGVTGSVAATIKESMAGASLYIEHVNASGGIGGEKIRMLTLDDKFDPELAKRNAQTLIEENHVLALFMSRGTPHTQGIIPLLEKYDLALIAPSTGAMVFHRPVRRQVFNVRSSYQREAQKAVQHLATVGTTRIALIYVDDSFGEDGLAGAMSGMNAANLKPVAVLKYNRDKPDYTQIVPEVVKQRAQAALWIGSGTAVVNGMKALRQADPSVQMLTLSNNASTGFLQQLGPTGRGVIITQVLPSERSNTYAFVREASDLAKKNNGPELSPAVLEGFVSAKVLVEALRQASPNPTRAKLIAALENMHKFDLGGLEIHYSKADHSGLDFADLAIITEDGRFRR